MALPKGIKRVHSHGHDSDLDTATGRVPVSDNGIEVTLQTSAVVLSIVSNSTEDDSAGAGARTIVLEGLDGDYSETTETVTLDGTTTVSSSNTYLRIFTAKVATAGGSEFAVGTVTIATTVTGDLMATIIPTEREFHSAQYTVPAGKTAYIYSWRGQADAALGSEVTLRLETKASGDQMFHDEDIGLASRSQNLEQRFEHPIECEAKKELRITAEASTDNTVVFADMHMLLVPDEVGDIGFGIMGRS